MKIGVVGCGLIGAAAARHLAMAGHQVLVIGPGEPVDKRHHQGVFGSHYDEGRITRRLATDRFWTDVSTASIDRYPKITTESGIPFHTPCHAMMAGATGSAFIKAARDTRQARRVRSEVVTDDMLANRLPFFNFPPNFTGFLEGDGAGHISPRALVAAQTAAARRYGAAIIPHPATGLSEHRSGVTIHTAQGDHDADIALLCAGAMTDHLAPRALHQRVYARTVALFEVDPSEATRLSAMPTLVFRWPGDTAEPYLLPPIRYPDGKTYLKLGGDPVDVELHSPAEIADWFRSGGNTAVRDHLEASLRRLMPDLAIKTVTMDACVTTFTPSGFPVIDWLSPRVATASGGNGAGAKCSDELGRLGAALCSGNNDPLLSHTAWTDK